MSPDAHAIVDTVVLRYFLIVGRTELLLDLLGSPIAVSRIVFDPGEGKSRSSPWSPAWKSIGGWFVDLPSGALLRRRPRCGGRCR